ncbi:MAG: endonuclease domain protein [Myxococcales bacterium]|nr:endonuclease domain protein [Myxococcales bacterium]
MSGGAAISKDSDSTVTAVREEYCRTLHERLVTCAKQRVVLEAEETRDLVLAEEAGIWRVFGYVTMQEYMERELHYSRHAANERLRVARELFELPDLYASFKKGEAPWAVMREVTRVAVPENQDEWLEAVKGKTAAQVQQMVSGLKKGANPEDRPDPKLVRHGIVMDVDGESYAMWMAGRSHADLRHGARLTDDEIVRASARAMIDPEGSGSEGNGTSAPCLHAVTTCKQCKRSSLVANGMEVPLDEPTAARMLCDSALVGDLESEEITRLVPAIPKATRTKCFIRAKFACEVPGCRSKKHLDCHHIVFRSQGGSNKLWNIVILCSGHHQALHEGRLWITGRAPDGLVFEFRREWDDEVHRTMTTVPGDVFVDAVDTGAPVTVPAGTERTVRGTMGGANTATDQEVAVANRPSDGQADRAVPAGTDHALTAVTDRAMARQAEPSAVPASTSACDETAGPVSSVPAFADAAADREVTERSSDALVHTADAHAVPAVTDRRRPSGDGSFVRSADPPPPQR